MKETEITVQCFDDLQTIFCKLKKEGFVFKEKYFIHDWYFSAKDIETLKKLKYIDLIKNSFLIRQIVDEKSETNQICYKLKELDENGNVVSENKTKAEVANLKESISIFQLSGLNMWCESETICYVYKNTEIEFCIQEVKELGVFIEVEEFQSIKNLTSAEKFKFMAEVIKKYNLSIGNDFSCKKIYMKFKSQNI